MDRATMGTALDAPIDDFLAHGRMLGRGYVQEEYILRGVRHFLLQVGANDLGRTVFDRWCEHLTGISANTRRHRQQVVLRFCLHRRRTDPTCFVPDPLYFAKPQSYRQPVLVEPEQIARMLACAAARRPTPNSPLRSQVLRLAIVLLYTAGLRRGELLRLTLADIDEQAGVVRVCESKFHKSRFVPLSSSAHQELCRYLRARRAVCDDQRPDAPLLCNRSRGWRAYTGTGLSNGLREVFDRAGVRDGARRRPCIHDLRHSFAVQALTGFYRRGEEVQSRLPHLALYMGHVSIASTAYYLHFIPTLAGLASERLAQQCGHVIEEVPDDPA